MEIMEIISEAAMYPLNNIKALVVYVILGIVAALVLVFTGVGIVAGAASKNLMAAGGIGIIGIIIAIIIGLLIEGYVLDIIKLGIERSDDAPGIDFVRQVINGIKLIVVEFVYFIIPILITFILAIFLQEWLATVIGIILIIIFSFLAFMGQCRLAKTESLGYALSIGEAFNDIFKIGIVKLLLFIVAVVVFAFIISLIITGIAQLSDTIGAILYGIFGIYYVFFQARATGLLYSEV